MNENILIFCAHSDDEAAGMGGTIIKYQKEDKHLIKIVFSYGESSHPHLKEKHVKKTRVQETQEISETLGIKETIFLGLADRKVKEELEKYEIKDKIIKIINNYSPRQIFIPSSSDIHPDHRAVNEVVLKALDEIDLKCDVLAYEVWNFGKLNLPQIYVDISNHFREKIRFMKEFKSQLHYMYPLIFSVIIRDRMYGSKIKVKYAERFYKLR